VLKRFHRLALSLTIGLALVAVTLTRSNVVVSQKSAVTVAGTVQTIGDEPVGGVWVSLIRRSGDGLVDSDLVATLGGASVIRVQSDDAGRFSLDLPVGSYDVRAYESGFHAFANVEPVSIQPSSDASIRVRLQPTASLSGKLLGLNEQVDGGIVMAIPRGEGESAERLAAVGGDRFSLVGLEPGLYDVKVVVPGYVPVVVDGLSLDDGEHLTGLEVRLDKGRAMRGMVQSADGEAADGVTIRTEHQEIRAYTQTTQSHPDGSFEVTGLVQGTYRITTISKGHATTSTHVSLGETELEALTLTLDPLGRLTGALSSGVGRGGIVFAIPEGGNLTDPQDPTGLPWIPGRILDIASGAFEIEGIPEGGYHIAVVTSGYLRTYLPGTADPEEAATITILEGETTQVEPFDLITGSTLSGRMVDRNTDEPIAGATVEVASLDRRETLVAVTDEDGRYSLSGVDKGRYLVKVRAEGYVAQFFPGVTRAEEATSLDVDGQKEEKHISVDMPLREAADFNEDGTVDVTDLDRFVDRVRAGGITTNRVFDPNLDGVVTYDDFEFVTQQVRDRGRMVDPPSVLEWKSTDTEPGLIRAALRVENLVSSVGYLAKVHFDTEVAEFEGAEPGESLFKDGRLRVEEIGPGVLLILAGSSDRDEREGDGELVSLMFRPKDGQDGVRVRTDAVITLMLDGRMAAPVLPDPVRLTLPPDTFYLLQNVPNPFNPETTIAYELPEAVQVHLAIFNLVGQRVRGLVDDFKTQGRYEVRWDAKDDFGRDVGSGVYFYSLEAGSFSTTKRMLLIR
jgi:hypothetical protein